MAGIIPNLAPATGDRASSAQVIDGSLKFNDDKGTHLKKGRVLMVIEEDGLGVVG